MTRLVFGRSRPAAAGVLAAAGALAAVLAVAGCTSAGGSAPGQADGQSGAGQGAPAARTGAADAALDRDTMQVLRESFRDRGIATRDRIEQDELQRTCSQYADRPIPREVAERLEREQAATIRYPADGNYLGDWRAGERIAQSGVGQQWTDRADTVAGGNCYACHQLARQELSFGNLGPSLYQYGKIRGNSAEVQRYTWGRIWNSQAFHACNNMPRFGHKGILTEQQIRDLMALLLDPASPVNQ